MVLSHVDCILQTVPECCVARRVLVLMVVHEESLRANHAVVPADVIKPPIVTSEWSLSPLVLSDPVLVGTESRLHLLPVVLVPPVEELLENASVLELLWFQIRAVSIHASLEELVDDSPVREGDHIPELFRDGGFEFLLREFEPLIDAGGLFDFHHPSHDGAGTVQPVVNCTPHVSSAFVLLLNELR